jgi:hypothetical protein
VYSTPVVGVHENSIGHEESPPLNRSDSLLVSVNEEITAKAIIDRMMTQGRKEVPTNRSLAAKLKKDKDFMVVRPNCSQGPTIFKRIG